MLKNASAGEKAGWFNGRTPLFSQKDLLRLVGPLLIEQFLAVTVGMADTMMVSRCGEAAISGVSLVDMINNLIIVLFAALATGGAVVVRNFTPPMPSASIWARRSRKRQMPVRASSSC